MQFRAPITCPFVFNTGTASAIIPSSCSSFDKQASDKAIVLSCEPYRVCRRLFYLS